jgi:hypothetical protein
MALAIVNCFVCTLGVGAFMIGLLIVAAEIEVVFCVHWEVVVSFGFGAVSLGGQVAWLKVTCLFSCNVLSVGVECIVGELCVCSCPPVMRGDTVNHALTSTSSPPQ